jgi:hypothetical protein
MDGGLHGVALAIRCLTSGGSPAVRWVAAAAVAALAGCGGDSAARDSRSAATPAPRAATPQATPTPAPRRQAPKAATLVFFQRQGAAGATLDTITVRVDGTATHEKRYGGAGGRFRELVLRDGQLARVRHALAGLPERGASLTRGSPPPGGAQYLLRYRGRTLTGRQGGIARPARPAVRVLDGYLDGIGVRRVTRDRATGSQ